jgi:hypothetical protein
MIPFVRRSKEQKMSSDANTLSERVITSFTKLSSASKDLNKVSDELGQAITAIDCILQRLNLGVPTWVKIHGGEDQYTGMEYWRRDIGYAKVGNKWGVALRTVEGDYNYPEEASIEEWLFNDAPRWIRVEGVEKIPDLLEDLVKNTVETTQKIKGKIEQAKQLAGALEQAAAEKPASKMAVVSKPLVDLSAISKALGDASAVSKAIVDAGAWNLPKGKK